MRVTMINKNWRIWLGLGFCLLLATSTPVHAAPGGVAEPVRLTIRLRTSDGAAVVGETVRLERLPEAEPVAPACRTSPQGECTWSVPQGLYQVSFTRPPDEVSAQALAEGGLTGLGLTVGTADITYPFTFHSDGHVYFDASPEAAVPSPLIPPVAALSGGLELSATPSPPPAQPVDVTATRSPESATPEKAASEATPGHPWRLIRFIGGGLVIGGSLHLWSRRKQITAHQTRSSQDDPASRPDAEETSHA